MSYDDYVMRLRSCSRGLRNSGLRNTKFMLMCNVSFHSNHGPISYRFRDSRRFQLKIAKFSNSLYFAPPLKGSPWNLVPALGVKNRMMGYRTEKEV